MDLLSEKQKDLDAIARVHKGDRQAYADIVRRYQSRILALCRTMLHSQADAEDAAQEIFFKAYQSLERFRGDSAFYTWLYRIASNHCLSRLRAAPGQAAESLDLIVEEQKEGLFNLFAATPDPRRVMEAKHLAEQILASLRPNYRLVITLRERDELSYEEIAQITDTTLDSVKATLKRAREECEEKLRHFLPPDSV